jgi:transposase InsO family protein
MAKDTGIAPWRYTHKETAEVFKEVISSHYEQGYGARRISLILSVTRPAHTENTGKGSRYRRNETLVHVAVYPNIIRDFIPVSLNRGWVSDITYITLWQDEYSHVFCYLSLILDACTEEIAGWLIPSFIQQK